MPSIHLLQSGRKLTCETGSRLMDVLLDGGVFLENPCSGTGVCGKCRVRIVAGEASPVTDTERSLLSEELLSSGVRLSCLTTVEGDMDVELLHQERAHKVLTSGYIPPFERDTFEGGYGIAIDIGTTTVAAALVDLKTGKELAQVSRINAQKRFGLDVLTRITYEYRHPETGAAELQKAIVDSLNTMIMEACEATEVSASEITSITVAANCTMTHMLLGVDARPIGRAPYQPPFLAAQTLPAAEIGLLAGDGAELYCLPQVSAYIGADITAGAYVCGLEQEPGNVLFIDIGTNGEIVLACGGRLLSCSCAAGPALEGANISCGMRADDGAIEDLMISEDGISMQVIGGEQAVGLCGSGILAAVKELLRTKLVKPSGAFIKPDSLPEDSPLRQRLLVQGTKREFLLQQKPELRITQDDVRQVQLAKGAILSGFMALLNRAGIDMKDLDKVLIAGQFGSHLPAESLAGTGILPRDVEKKLIYVGNSSKTGAYMALLSAKARTDMETLARKMEYMELAESEGYEALFAKSMKFPQFD